MRHMPTHAGVQGFTLIEMLVVVAIIAILTALLLPGLTSLMDSQSRLQATRDLEGLTMAINQYLLHYGMLGDDHDSQDFQDRPMHFLAAQPRQAGTLPYYELDPQRMLQHAGDGIYVPTNDPDLVEAFADPWGSPYFFFVNNVGGRAGHAADEVWIFTYGRYGPGNPRRAQGRYLQIGAGEWRSVAGSEAVPEALQ